METFYHTLYMESAFLLRNENSTPQFTSEIKIINIHQSDFKLLYFKIIFTNEFVLVYLCGQNVYVGLISLETHTWKEIFEKANYYLVINVGF